MISATEALFLPTAQLKEEELAAVAGLMAEIDTAVHQRMARNGIDLTVDEKRASVIAEVNQRLKAKNWEPTWQATWQESRVSGTRTHTGYLLTLAPSDEAYRAAAARAQT